MTTLAFISRSWNPQEGHPLLTCHNRGAITLYHSPPIVAIFHTPLKNFFFKPGDAMQFTDRENWTSSPGCHCSISISLSCCVVVLVCCIIILIMQALRKIFLVLIGTCREWYVQYYMYNIVCILILFKTVGPPRLMKPQIVRSTKYLRDFEVMIFVTLHLILGFTFTYG